jgi:hypothetical protein
MRYRILVVLAAVLCCSTLALAKDEAKPVAKQQPAAAQTMQMSQADQEKELLIANINNMRNQEIRAAVLQQLLNEEIAKLRNVQALFCDKYQLDVDKFRQGMYRYDEKAGKFVLQPAAQGR